MKFSGSDLVWSFKRGGNETGALRRWLGLSVIGLVVGLISGVVEAKGECVQGAILLVYPD
jgi:diacylglycerol kinase (CTP)